ncbi:MAG: hypothetical protein HY821_23940 [Acidobacteria bacterium]|nr:hypothetical protein [Acidobacteriota bacterium]
MAFTINTNIASMQAQEYLRATSDFQAKTINRVTSGLRIVNSGDDAAGLAIANGFRSDQAVLNQGIRNANDGLATLQTIDGGINNISKLLDRARSLAAQSASGTFTGSRSVLNSEFQNVMSEIDRQAQAIGMNTGGKFAKSLSVFIGGGRNSAGDQTGADAIANGSVGVNLSTSTVDTQSLGLKGFEARGAVSGGLQSSSTTNLQAIVADTNNTTAVAGRTTFYVQGAGFTGSDRIKLDVNMSGTSTTATLAEEVNKAIDAAGNAGTAAAEAFKAANLRASVYTDSTGKEQLTFTSSNSAFQVKAGDKMANAIMGNFSAGTQGASVSTSVTTLTGVGSFAAGTMVKFRVEGGGLSTAETLTLDVGGDSIATAVSELKTAVDGNANLKAAGITMDSIAGFTAGDGLTLRNDRGESFSVTAVGDTADLFGMGTWMLDSTDSMDYTSITAIEAPATNASSLRIKVGESTVTVNFTPSAGTGAGAAAAFNSAVAALGDSDRQVLQNAGIVADAGANTFLRIRSANNTNFLLTEVGTEYLGFDNGTGTAVAAAAFSNSPSAALALDVATIESAGAYQATSTGDTNGEFYSFSKIAYGTGDQTVSVTAVDASGTKSSVAITLKNDSTTSANNTGRSIDEALAEINKQLQQTNDASLKKIVAVKDNDGAGNEGIRFISSLAKFEVSIGSTATNQGIKDESAAQGVSYASAQIGTGANNDISTQAGAEAAVTSLAEAVVKLGDAQAVVGRGQNQFNYAVSLASTQLTNLAASESRIRDADLANEAANLTKAQILTQAGVAALAQANSAPQAVLSLLRG